MLATSVKGKGAIHQTKYNYLTCRSVLVCAPLVNREKYAFWMEQLISFLKNTHLCFDSFPKNIFFLIDY